MIIFPNRLSEVEWPYSSEFGWDCSFPDAGNVLEGVLLRPFVNFSLPAHWRPFPDES